MIGLLKDGHSNLAGWTDSLAALDASYNGWFLNYPLNQLRSIQYHYGIVFNSVFDYGITSKNAGSNGANFFGYIHIKTFNSFIDRKEYEAIDTLLKKLESNDGLIIDVRSNGGGNPDYADLIASRFAQTKKFTYKYRTRNGPGHNDFTGWTDSYLSPNYKYDKPIVVLTNRSTFSAAEGFVIDMKAQQSKTITILGDTTGGGSSDPSISELPNGWIVRVSNTQRITFEGRDYQFTGIYPDVPVWIKQSDEQLYIDSIIEAAMDVLISKSNLHINSDISSK
jgi:C-terminal processing protease CtpA/Prc